MNAIQYAVSRVKMSIPKEILNVGFPSSNPLETVDSRIISSVIRPLVLTDCDIVGGVAITIPLDNAEIRYNGIDGVLFYIPPILTNNRTIMSVTHITHSFNTLQTSGVYPTLTTNNLETSFDKAVSRAGGGTRIPMTILNSIEIIGEGLIMCSDKIINLSGLKLVCTVGYDHTAFNALSPRSYPVFTEACKLATESIIFNRAVIKVGSGILFQGHEVSKMKEIIESYADKYKEYNEYVETELTQVLLMNDGVTYHNYVDLHFGSNI